jgi:hypothetical protein
MTDSQPVQFEILAAQLGYAVSGLLQRTSGRWVATSECLGSRYLGIGATAREALSAAFGPLGARIAAILMADPALFGVSLQVRAA